MTEVSNTHTGAIWEYPGEYEEEVGFRDGGSTEICNLNGVPWHDAPTPPRLHRCWVQTYGYINYFDRIERCACGGRCFGRRNWERFHWIDKNSRAGTAPDESSSSRSSAIPTWTLVTAAVGLLLIVAGVLGAKIAPDMLGLWVVLSFIGGSALGVGGFQAWLSSRSIR